MAKTRRNRRKQRKTRKQRGGILQYEVKGIMTPKKTFVFDAENTITARQLLQKIQDVNFAINNNTTNSYSPNQDVPPFTMSIGQKIHKMKNKENWDSMNLLKNVKYKTIQFYPEGNRTKKVQNKLAKKKEETVEVIENLINTSLFKEGASIILGSAATTRFIEKNIKQQFFNFKPVMRTILIDPLFTSGTEYDFFNIVEMTELDASAIGPKDIIRIFCKPKGQELKINESPEISGPSNEYKEEYLKRMERVAGGKNNLTNIDICIAIVSHAADEYALPIEGISGRNINTGIDFPIAKLVKGKPFTFYTYEGLRHIHP
jgi:hypothetical protein